MFWWATITGQSLSDVSALEFLPVELHQKLNSNH
jgi:hypothetical protein